MESYSGNEMMSSTCGPAFNRVKGRIAARLRETAKKLSTQNPQASAGGEWSTFISHTQGWMESAADRVEQLDPGKVKMDFEKNVRRNPGKSLLIAGATGLLLGALLRRR